jgi:acetolactate synthase-1/2/3 large subunit
MMSYRMNDSFPSFTPRTYLFPSSYGTLGFSVPAAIGAKIGRPDAPVVAVVGDGGFQFTMQELATAIQFEVTLPIVIFNDSTYTAVEQAMKYEFEGRVMATDLINPDYVKLADAYGIPGVRAESPAALIDAIQAALERRGPTIIDVPIPRM